MAVFPIQEFPLHQVTGRVFGHVDISSTLSESGGSNIDATSELKLGDFHAGFLWCLARSRLRACTPFLGRSRQSDPPIANSHTQRPRVHKRKVLCFTPKRRIKAKSPFYISIFQNSTKTEQSPRGKPHLHHQSMPSQRPKLFSLLPTLHLNKYGHNLSDTGKDLRNEDKSYCTLSTARVLKQP